MAQYRKWQVILKYYVHTGLWSGKDGCQRRREAIACLFIVHCSVHTIHTRVFSFNNNCKLNMHFSSVFTREDTSSLPVPETKFNGSEGEGLGIYLYPQK